jgi:DNA-binding transcriptional MerR regulator
MDWGWRSRIRGMLEKGMSLEEIAENLNHKGKRRPHGSHVVSDQCAKRVRLLATEPGLE